MRRVGFIIANGTVLSWDNGTHEKADVLVEADRVKAIAPGLSQSVPIEKVIDAKGKFVMPGFVNAHTHSFENFLKGWFDGYPLELWMLKAYGPLNHGPFSKRLLYIRTMLGAIEMIRGGITTVQDHLTEFPAATAEGTDAVLHAYCDVGLRANVGLNVGDRPWYESLPFLQELLPEELLKRFSSSNDAKKIVALYKDVIGKWHGARGRIQIVAAPSGPQRCSDGLLVALSKLATEYDLTVHSHVLETLTQFVTGEELYGRTIVEHMQRLGILSEKVSLAHGVWVTDEDVSLMAESGVSVVHNPVSNLSLGSGIMPLRRLLDAGVNVCLGTDGISPCGSLNIFEAMKWTLLLHRLSSTDYTQWPTCLEILKMATINGAKALGLGDQVGSLTVGKKADIVVLNPDAVNYVPLRNAGRQIVLSEHGSSVDTVIVNGQLLMEDREMLTCNEKELLEEARALAEDASSVIKRSHNFSKQLQPYVEKIYHRCASMAKPVERLAIGKN